LIEIESRQAHNYVLFNSDELRPFTLPENRRKATELPTEYFHRYYIPTEIIPSPNLSVYTDGFIPSVIPLVYTDGIFPTVYTDGFADGVYSSSGNTQRHGDVR